MTNPGMGPPPGAPGDQSPPLPGAPGNPNHLLRRQAVQFLDGLAVGASLSLTFALFANAAANALSPTFEWALFLFAAVALLAALGCRTVALFRGGR